MTIYSPEEHFGWGSGQYSKVEVTSGSHTHWRNISGGAVVSIVR